MMNLNNKKTKRVVIGVVALVLILCMIVPGILAVLV